jgi:rubrerythrin
MGLVREITFLWGRTNVRAFAPFYPSYDREVSISAPRMGAHEGLSRAEWLERGAAVAAGLAAGGIVAGGFASLASSSAPTSKDAEVLNFALAFEELQASFYAQASRAVKLHGDWREYARVVEGHERAHVAFLRRTLGAKAKPSVHFELTHPPSTLADFKRLAIGLEDTGVALYNGQAGNLTPQALAAAAEIISVEARHAAWARDLAGELPAPVPTDPPADEAQVKARLEHLGVNVG